MMAGVVEETIEQKFKRHQDALVACMAEITKLRAENARLRSSENNAHSVLREIYNDPDAPQGVRVKAAGLALQHETPKLLPERAPLDLQAESEPEPLAVTVERQRARANRLLALSLEERSALITGVRRDDGNGSDDSSSND
jgi:uncharacterized protein (UPF0147 family)